VTITVTTTITITITIAISPGLNVPTYIQNQWEAVCGFRWKN
jgi:hypothetical protein